MKKLSFFAFILFATPTYASQVLEDYRQMDEIALHAGADKGSHFHNYTEVYSRYFAPLRDKPIKFLEIGINTGSSVKMWEEYFPFAELHFMDITFENIQYHTKRAQYHQYDQENISALEHFAQENGSNFDVILDDGGHTMRQQIHSFIALFPHVKSGGMYIIEDLHTSYWPGHFGGGGEDSTVNFLKKLIDEVNYVGATTTRANHTKLPLEVLNGLNLYQKEIYSMHFYDSIVIIIKR